MLRGWRAATGSAMAMLALAVPAAPAGGAAGAAAGGAANGSALVVGDSLEVLTSPYLSRHLPGVRLTIDAEGGYNSNQIFELFERSFEPSHSVIVFDAGTNDNPAYPEILAGNLRAVAERVGDRCMVVPTIHGLTVNGIGNEGKNRVVEAFAAARPGTQVPDWAGAVAAHPELMQADDLHPVPAGADYRARLIAQGIEGCLAFMSSAGAEAEAALESAPRLAPVGKLAARQRQLAAALGAALARHLAAAILAGGGDA